MRQKRRSTRIAEENTTAIDTMWMGCKVAIIQVTVWILWLRSVEASQLQKGARAAAMSLLLGRRQAVAQDGAVLQRHANEKAACRTVAQRREIKARMISRLQGSLRPARTRQHART